ncbi:DUF2897 family protein [Alkalimonas mucilaginosa]|uniref:DUF2897 family protein n=1 Tax=Alkalimonas mucilaginosa TaxID=3057676 RepID=A0ABU7JIM3_9GAMM|nr:DUF2897 family protein [Alkalimonas sp. MEB004]MEE2025188.1 DUF2897 family protein [Alkalimonas sp. MEB004]
MNWALFTALVLAFGVILGNLMLLRHLDKLSGAKTTKPTAKPDENKSLTDKQGPLSAKNQGQASETTKPGPE